MINKKWFQHSIALVAFLIVSIMFCRPVLEGKILIASDNFQTIGSMHEADNNIKNTDANVTGWTGTMFSGMPVYRTLLPNKLLSIVYGMKQAEHAHSFDVLLWLMVSFYVLCLALGVSPWISLFFSIGYAFTAFNIMSMEHGHFFKIFSSSMVPGTIGGIILLLRGKYLEGAIVFILFLNLLTGINHTQITYYAMLVSFITVLVFAVHELRNRGWKPMLPAFGLMLIALALSITSNIGIINNAAMAEATIRGGQSELTANQGQGSGLDKGYASSWSMDIIEAFTYIIPNFAGGPSSNYLVQDRDSHTYKALRSKGGEQANQLAQQTSAYWGNQPFVGGGFYMGAVFSFLFLLYLIFARDYKRYWLAASFVLILLLALGKNIPAFYDMVFNHLPLYNKFRVPSMINLLMQFVIVIGAALCINTLTEKDLPKKRLYIVGGSILAFVTLLVFAAPGFFSFSSRAFAETGTVLPDWLESALRKDRIAIMKKDGIRTILFIGLVATLIWAYVEGKLKNKNAFIIGIGILACIDVIGNATRHISEDNFLSKRKAFSIFSPTQADAQIMADIDPHFRVFNLTRSPFNDAITSYNHKSIGGYHGAKLRRYQELIEAHISKNNMSVLNMLNTKYFIVNGNNGPEARRNNGACGNAWFVDSIKVVSNGDEEINALNPPFDPRSYSIIQESYSEGLAKTYSTQPGDYIKLKSYSPDKMVYESNSQSGGFAVFSEIYYILDNGSGWHAYINDEEQEIRKVNFTLRGMSIPAGQQEIIFEFDKNSVLWLNKIRGIFSILTAFIVLGLLGWYVKREMDNQKGLASS